MLRAGESLPSRLTSASRRARRPVGWRRPAARGGAEQRADSRVAAVSACGELAQCRSLALPGGSAAAAGTPLLDRVGERHHVVVRRIGRRCAVRRCPRRPCTGGGVAPPATSRPAALLEHVRDRHEVGVGCRSRRTCRQRLRDQGLLLGGRLGRRGGVRLCRRRPSLRRLWLGRSCLGCWSLGCSSLRLPWRRIPGRRRGRSGLPWRRARRHRLPRGRAWGRRRLHGLPVTGPISRRRPGGRRPLDAVLWVTGELRGDRIEHRHDEGRAHRLLAMPPVRTGEARQPAAHSALVHATADQRRRDCLDQRIGERPESRSRPRTGRPARARRGAGSRPALACGRWSRRHTRGCSVATG
jgi:hypothetical protein